MPQEYQNWLCLQKDLLDSKAFKDLTKTSTTVFFKFRARCQVDKPRGRKEFRKPWPIRNNGKLVYTYAEAKKNGIACTSYTRAIDQLIGHGFLDLAYQGSGLKGDNSLYGMSDRWRKWGTPEFENKKRRKDKRRPGRRFLKKKKT